MKIKFSVTGNIPGKLPKNRAWKHLIFILIYIDSGHYVSFPGPDIYKENTKYPVYPKELEGMHKRLQVQPVS